MGKRDGYSRGAESLEDIRASDRFIEQLRVSGTYEPSSRTDATMATALLTWRDEARQESLTPAPRVEQVGGISPFAQPRRIARRGVAAAAVLLAMSSAVATAFDGDPLRPVRFLVDLGVDVGERIAHPDGESSSGEAPEVSIEGSKGGGDSAQRGDAKVDEKLPEIERPSNTGAPAAQDEPGDAGTEPPSVTSTQETAPEEGQTPAEDEGDPTDPTPTDPSPTDPSPSDPSP